MYPEKVLRRNSVLLFGCILLFSFWAFWPAYLSGALTQVGWRVHFHGITLFLWCVLMVMQAYLIRSDRRSIHRQTGKLSYLLAPLVVIASLSAAQNIIGRGALEAAYEPYLLAFILGILAQFVFTYALGIYHRKNPAIHSRFMICTALPMVPPILDRIMFYFLLPPSRAGFLPTIEGMPTYEFVSYTVVDAVLVVLSIWDWKCRRRLNVFPVVLGASAAFQVLPVLVYGTALWSRFFEWFVRLPL